MNKSKQVGNIVLVLAGLLTACTLSPTPTLIPVATESPLPALSPAPERLPFEGMWMSAGDEPVILVFSKDSMYKVEADLTHPDQAYQREQFANVLSYDLENNHISLRTQWMRVAGLMRGFDAPNFNITYLIDGDTLRVGLGWEEFAAETDPLLYYRK